MDDFEEEGRFLLLSDDSARNIFLRGTKGSERRLDGSENIGHWSSMLLLDLSARSFDQNTEKNCISSAELWSRGNNDPELGR